MRSHQPSSWAWKSSGFANRRPASKLPCRKRWLRSSAPLAWQSPASRITQPSASWPQNARNCSVGRPCGAIAPSRSQTSLPGSAPSRARQRLIPNAMSAELLGEHQRAGERARVGQLAGHDVAAARLAPADRDLRARLAQIELRQLARPITGALEAARRRQQTAAAARATDRRGSSCRPHSRASRAPRGRAPPTASARQRAAPRSPRRTARASTAAAAAAHRPAASTTPARCGSCRDGRPCGDGSRAARGPPRASTAGSPPTAPRQATPSPGLDQQIEPDHRPGRTTSDPAPRWTTFRPAQADQYSGGAYTFVVSATSRMLTHRWTLTPIPVREHSSQGHHRGTRRPTSCARTFSTPRSAPGRLRFGTVTVTDAARSWAASSTTEPAGRSPR